MLLKRGLIVSCQAAPGEPMHGSEIMARMAAAAEEGGAVAVRVNTAADISAVRKAVSLPILGLIKTEHKGFWPYITTTLDDVDKVVEAGADIVCIDATFLPRYDGNTVEEFYSLIRGKYPEIEILADISTYEEGVFADKLGCDYIATTLWGYTPETDTRESLIHEFREPNIELVKQLAASCEHPVIAEGRIHNGEYAVKAMNSGAYAVTIGWGITRPQIITKYIVDQLKKEVEGL